MSSSGFIEPSVEISGSAVNQPKAEVRTEEPPGGPPRQEKSWDDFDGYAEFVNYMVQHRIPIFSDRYLVDETTMSVIGQGGTYVVRTAKLAAPLRSYSSRPFLLKTSPEALALGEAIESRSVEAGTNVVTKHIDFRNLKQRRAQGRVPAYRFLKPFQTEVTILSHPFIREHMAFPSLLGIGLEISPDDVGETPQLYPFLVMELGRQGSVEQSLQELWYRLFQEVPGSPGQYDLDLTYPKIVLSWGWKMSLAHSICTALCVLHRFGVVHGDVKLSNTLTLIMETEFIRSDQGKTGLSMSEKGLAQLADFGSSILLSEIPRGAKSRLRSHTPPWNAPESTSDIQREDLVKTDIYSYGLFFGRIMLQGASPFASEFDAASFLGFNRPEHDFADIKRLRDADKVDEHIYEKIRATDFYSEEQLQVIKRVLSKTLRTEIKDRIGTMDPIREFLVRCATSGPEEAAKSVAWEESMRMRTMSLGDGLQYDVAMQDPRDEYFIQTSSASYTTNVPNILDPIFADLRYERILLREVFQDFKQQIARHSSDDSRMAQIHYQTALCYYNGWGTPTDTEQFQIHLHKALSLGSSDALCHCQLVRDSSFAGSDYPTIEVEAQDDLYHAMLTQFSGNVDMCKAAQLQNISAELFEIALGRARNVYYEYTDGQRLEIDGVLPMFMEHALSSGPEPTDLMLGFDNLPEDHEEEQGYADTPLIALCLAASQGNMEYILELFNHLQDRTGGIAEGYLNRSTKSAAMNFSVVEFDQQDQSGHDLDGPLPELSFKLEEHTRPLMMACSNGHSGVVLALLSEGADPNQVDSSGRCPLHYLARFDPDQVEEVGDLLLEGQPDTLVDTVDNDGHSPLAFVLDTERNWVPESGVVAARFLLRRGATWYNTANPTAMLRSPLVKAVLSFNMQAMKLVKEFIQSSITERPKGNSARHFDEDQEEWDDQEEYEDEEDYEATTGRTGERSVISADEFHASSSNDAGCTVDLEQTVFQNQIVNAIIALAREPNSVICEREATYGTTLASVIQFLVGSLDARFPTSAFATVVRLIVQLGAGIDLLKDSMALAARNFPDMLTTLAELGYRVDQISNSAFQGYHSSWTFFHMAGYHRIPTVLVEHICQISSIDYKSIESASDSSPIRLNAFDTAVTDGNFKLADYLVDQGADFSSPHLQRMLFRRAPSAPLTILGYVLTSVLPDAQNTPRRGEMIQYLLNFDPDPVVCPDLKQNVFHLVWRKWAFISKDYFHPETDPEDAFNEVMAVFEQLHEYFKEPSLLTARDINGATPIHFAAESGNIHGVERLIELGANANAKDKDGKPPMGYAGRAIRHAINDTVSGRNVPIEIDLQDLMRPIMDLVLGKEGELFLGHIDRSVVLNRVLQSIRKHRQIRDDTSSGEATFRTKREEPTEILLLVEVSAYLMHFCRMAGLEDEEDDIYSAD